MGRAYTKYYDGFTLSFFHDSDHCSRCKKLSTFYSKMKNKEPPWDKEDARKVEENCPPSQLKLFGVISYLNSNSCGVKEKRKVNNFAYVKNKRKHQIKRSSVQSSHVTRSHELQATNSVLRRNNMPSYQSYKKVGKKAIRRNVIDQNYKKDHKTNKRNLKSSPDSIEAENNMAEANTQSSVSVSLGELDERYLKRRLRIINKLKRKNNYEDDIFEEKCFYVVKTSNDEESDSNDIKNMATPKCEISLSPRARSVSPVYEDCYSPKELGAIRRDAEEFRYRRKKRRRMDCPDKEEDVSDVKEDVKSEDTDHKTLLENVCKAVPLKPEKDSDTDDSYFSDSSEDQS